MGSIFSAPKPPKVQAPPPVVAPPPVPTVDEAANAQREGDILRKRQGRAAAVLSDNSAGSLDSPTVGRKTLLGG
jgi:hypothetical protein